MAALASLLLVLSTLWVRPAPQGLLLVYAGLVALASGVEASLAPATEGRIPASDSPAIWLAQASGLLLLAVWLGGPLTSAGPPPPWAPPIGVVVLIAGSTLRAVAIARLGGRFNSDNHIETTAVLETGGLYRRLAHPSEVGLLLLALGAAIFWSNAGAALLVAAAYLVSLARLRLEETALTRRYGALYAAYRRTTFDPFPTLPSRGAAGI